MASVEASAEAAPSQPTISDSAVAERGPDEPQQAWYIPEAAITDALVSSEARALFEGYSGIAPADVLDHIRRLRRAAFKVAPYPCIGELRFLDFSVSRVPSYDAIVELLRGPDTEGGILSSDSAAVSSSSNATTTKTPPALLDIGCFVGQDLRRLALSGVPQARLVGLDVKREFIELGFQLFGDRDTWGGEFEVADAFSDGDDDGKTINEGRSSGGDDVVYKIPPALRRRFDVVHAASFLHLFNWERQLAMAARLAAMLKDRVGVRVVGRQVGSLQPGEFAGLSASDEKMYRHDAASFQRLWDLVGEKTTQSAAQDKARPATRWRVSASMEAINSARNRREVDSHFRIMSFEVERVA